MRISATPCHAKAEFRNNLPNWREKSAIQKVKMPTTTNNRRAYIRRSLAIAWSSRRRSLLKSINVAVKSQIGTPGTFRKGPTLVRNFPDDGSPRGWGSRRACCRLRHSPRLGRLAELAKRSKDDCRHEHDRRDKTAQDAPN